MAPFLFSTGVVLRYLLPMASRKGSRSFTEAVEISAAIILIIAAVFMVNLFMGQRLNFFGILPRTYWGLLGVIFSPMLHLTWGHLVTNLTSLFVLLVILFSHKEYKGQESLLWIWLGSGLGTWVLGRSEHLGRPQFHIGASGVIYGLVVYLIVSGCLLRSWRSALVGLLVLFLYGGIFYGMLPQPGMISWEGHLSGAFAGLATALRQHK